MIDDTIVAPATTPGTGAISVIRMSGPDALRICDAVVRLRSGNIAGARGYTIHFGEIRLQNELLDEVLVSVFRAPHSYTGEDSVEISTHASAYIVEEVVRLLLEAGARFAEPGEFTRRAFLNGKMDLAQAEAVADVIAAGNAAAHRVAMHQLKGVLSGELEALRGRLLEMASLLELELDFSEEEVEFAQRDQLLSLLEEARTQTIRLADSFRCGNLIKNGVPVAIVGAANAGKSTLLNSLVGDERAIVTDIPGTTRDTIEEVLNLDGVQFRFIDTAGIRNASDAVERMGIDRSLRKMKEAELVLIVLDGSKEEALLEAELTSLFPHLRREEQTLFLLLNKADLLPLEQADVLCQGVNNFVTSARFKATSICISAKYKKGIQKLTAALTQAVKELGVTDTGAVFVTQTRHYDALREATSALTACANALRHAVPTDLVAEDLRLAIAAINTILGTDLLDPEEILHNIFKNHCIGK